MKDLYTAKVSITSGRDGQARSDDAQLNVKLALPAALGGSGQGSNPEQLFVAGFAACFASSLKAASATLKQPVKLDGIDAEGVLSVREDGSYIVSAVTLTLRGESLTAAAAVVEEAKRICAYSNATRGNIAFTVRSGPG